MNDASNNQPDMTREGLISELTAKGKHFEFAEQTINGNPCRVFVNAPATLRDLFEHSLQFTDLDYLIYEDERYTYQEVYQHSAKIANALIEDYGFRQGDRVAIGMRNYPEWIASFLAITSIGGIAVALNSLWNGEELAYGLELTGAKIVIADRERVERLLPNAEKLDLQILSVRCETKENNRIKPLSDVIKSKSDSMPAATMDADDDALIIFTSGSTGHPKGAVSSHRAAIHAVMSWDFDLEMGCIAQGIDRPDEPWSERFKMLLAVPLFHVSGAHVAMIASLLRGREVHMMYKWDVLQALDIIEREQVTHFIAVSTMTGDLVRAAEEHQRSLSSLISVGGGGSPRPAQQVKDIDRVLENAAPGHGWGMTETNAIGTGIGGDAYLERPLSSGQCSAVFDLRILDDNDQDVEAGEPGHLVIRGTGMFREYWNRPDANADSFIDGWFRTGDIARIDDEGFMYIVDRAKDIVIRGGENIGCGEVEDAITSHPQVDETVVFGLPHERLGEEVATMVYCKPGHSVDDAALTQHLQEHLATFQIPSRIFYTDQPLPRIASGKFNKRGIRNELLEKLGLSNN